MVRNAFSEEDIIQGIRLRQDDVFEHLRKHTYGAVRLYITSNSGTVEDAQDTFAEGIIGLIKFIDNPMLAMSCKVSTLLVSICKNHWYQKLEKQRSAYNYRNKLVVNDYEEDTSDELDEAVYSNMLWDSFNKLKNDCKTIIRGYLEEMTHKEIAKILGLSPGYVKKKKHYCQEYLIQYVSEHPDYKKMLTTNEVSPL